MARCDRIFLPMLFVCTLIRGAGGAVGAESAGGAEETVLIGGRFVVQKRMIEVRDSGEVDRQVGAYSPRSASGEVTTKFVGQAWDKSVNAWIFLKCEPADGSYVQGVRGWRGWEVEEAMRGEKCLLTSDEVVVLSGGGGKCGVYPVAQPLERYSLAPTSSQKTFPGSWSFHFAALGLHSPHPQFLLPKSSLLRLLLSSSSCPFLPWRFLGRPFDLVILNLSVQAAWNPQPRRCFSSPSSRTSRPGIIAPVWVHSQRHQGNALAQLFFPSPLHCIMSKTLNSEP